jgi:hypothetical protein
LIEKLKKLADLKEELQELNSKVSEIREEKYRTKATQRMNAAFDEFIKYFSEKGFNTEKGTASVQATYKTEKITLGKSGQRDWLLTLSVNGKEVGVISIEETHQTRIPRGGAYFTSGSDELEREISITTQKIETAKSSLARVSELEFCYIIEEPQQKTEIGKEYSSFTEVLDKLLN